MNGYVVVDASVWVARLVAGDIFHDTSRRWLEAKRTGGERFLAPSLLLAEVAGAIARRTGEADLAATLGLRGADAFYVAVAAHLSVPLATLDTDQQGRAANVVEIWQVEVQ